MTETAGYAVNFLSVLTMAVTLLPLSTSSHWAVRMWDFPRFQIVCVGLVLLGIALTKGQQVMALSLAMCVVYQLTWIYPYTFLARPDVRIAQPNPELDISLLSANVEQGNSEFHLIADIIAPGEALRDAATAATQDAEFSAMGMVQINRLPGLFRQRQRVDCLYQTLVVGRQ